MAESAVHTRLIMVSGQVQGVGFRPFVYRLAREMGLSGWVCNAHEGVRIEVTGSLPCLDRFVQRLEQDAPAAARIDALISEPMPYKAAEPYFQIKPSFSGSAEGLPAALFPPDRVPCAACLDEMRNPGDRRYAYPFTNCTQCGPRFTITRSMPYDRLTTSMSCFPLCPECAEEYADPADRRFHAQPNACPVCGPRVWLVQACGRDEEPLRGNDAFRYAAQLLMQGRIVAIKGVGGFQLACDARSPEAVARLRQLKHRPHKAFALMTGSVEAARCVVALNEAEEDQLRHPAGPIVLCRKRDQAFAPIAPDSDELGMMLPSSALHVRLFAELAEHAKHNPVLVMTSGNAASAPLCTGNREALARLGDMADAFLLHDRDIVARADDSVLRVVQDPEQGAGATSIQLLRRARGYVPQAVELGGEGASILAFGADIKNTVCLTRGTKAYVSQHIGDTEHAATLAFMAEAASHLQTLLVARPEAVACDLHPNSLAAMHAEQYAREAGLPLYRVQHHVAHGYAVLAEHARLAEPVLCLALDGSGYGPDGTVWGGELLVLHPEQPGLDSRAGRLKPFLLPGGDVAVREPWRIVAALLDGADHPRFGGHQWPWAVRDAHRRPDGQALHQIIRAGIGTPTSSCGRLFDAVSACLGLCDVISYEGQAAVRLEHHAGLTDAYILDLAREGAFPPLLEEAAALMDQSSPLLELDGRAFFLDAARDVACGRNTADVAGTFHIRLAAGFACMARLAASRTGIRTVALSGGVMLNRAFFLLLSLFLQHAGLTVLRASVCPAGDGALSLGQAVWLRQALR